MGGRLRRSAYNGFNQDQHLDSLFSKLDTIMQNNSPIAFIDYDSDGLWMFGYVLFDKNKNKKITPIDRDTDIEILVKRVVYFWNIEPNDLWISETASFISAIKMSGMSV